MDIRNLPQSSDNTSQKSAKRFQSYSKLIQVLIFTAFGVLIYELGFESEYNFLRIIFNGILFLLAILYILRLFTAKKIFKVSRFIVEILIIIFLILITGVNLGLIDWETNYLIVGLPIESFLVNLLVIILFLIELSNLSLEINKLRLHPAMVFILSFLILIFIGTALLSIPKATANGIGFVDALFTATSAVCVTGLIVLDTSKDFTFFGQIIIMSLFQIGGLGIMTFTSFFGFFFKGSYSIQDQLFLKDYINEENIGSIYKTLIKIIGFTLIIEAITAFLIFSLIEEGLFENFGDQVFFSIFHAISAFCNAGFSTLSNGLYEEGFRMEYHVHLVIAICIVLGGIGFPVVISYYNYFKHVVVGTKKMITREEGYRHAARVVNVNSRLIVYTTVILLLIGFVTYFIFEYNHTLQDRSLYGKIVTAVFGAVTPRTAGFNTVDMSALSVPTILIYLILMWIGASPGSTGGGLKTSTFAVAVLNTLSIAKGKRKVEVFSRQINQETIQKAFAVILLSFLVIGLGVFFVQVFNPELELMDIAFEIFSAFSTVGLSLGITASLAPESKLIVSLIMFLGRVGTLTVLVAFIRKARNEKYKYPEESVFIT